MLTKGNENAKWFNSARLGLFIHWGLYSATEGFYHSEETKGIVEWIQSREQIPCAEYEKFAKDLSADAFDAGTIAALAKYAGMKYAVLTAKHHEGFAMFDTAYDDYSINARCGVKRDIVREFADAMRDAGIKPCLYYSQGVDFHEKNAAGNTWDFKTDLDERDIDAYLDGKCAFQLRELLTNYGDIGIMWFDVPWGITPVRAKRLRSLVKSLQPGCLINGRLGGAPEDSDYLCLGDNEAPNGRADICAEVCATTNDSWGYKRLDKNFKSPRTVIELLCSVCSKGANLLLNVGPRPDGSLPDEAVNILIRLGDWMKINGEAIYDTDASPFAADFSFGRVTQKGDRLYLMLFDKTDRITLRGLENAVLRAEDMHGGAVPFSAEGGLLTLDLTGVEFCDTVTVIRLTTDGAVRVAPGLFQQEEGTIALPPCACKITRGENSAAEEQTFGAAVDMVLGEYWGNPSPEMKVNINGCIECWRSEDSFISWEFEAAAAGEYDAVLYTATEKYKPWQGGHSVSLSLGGEKISAVLGEDIIPRGVNRRYFSETGSIIGKIRIPAPGKYTAVLRANKINPLDPAGLYVTNLVLTKRL